MESINTKLLRRLVGVLERIEHPLRKALLDQDNKAIAAKKKTEEHTGEPKPLPPANPIIGLHPAIEAYYQSEQHDRPSKDLWERIKRWFEFIGIAVAIWLGFLTYSSLQETRKQASIMQRQLEATDRPWIEITTAEVTTDANFFRVPDANQPVMTLGIRIGVKNVGRSVAQNVRMKGDLICQRGFDDDLVMRAQKRTCDMEHSAHISPQVLLFPDRETTENTFQDVFWTIVPNEAIHRVGDENMIQPVLVGCISYDIVGVTNHPHHTGFVYDVAPLVNGKNIEQRWLTPYAIDRKIGRSKMWLRGFSGFSDAN